MKNAMQLKAKVRNVSRKKNISAQLIMQNYMLEHLLERISKSRFHSHFILKGGLLIGAMVGLDTRTTMDMDMTLKGLALNEENILKIFNEICSINIEDNINFEILTVEEIRERDEYKGYRISLLAYYPPMEIPLKVDLTTGDKITPKEIQFSYQLTLDERTLSIAAYNLETILAEKIETIITRGDQNTRMRDFYDIYILINLKWREIDIKIIKQALYKTSQKRNSLDILRDYQHILESLKSSLIMHERWENYQRNLHYMKDIQFDEICLLIMKLMNDIHCDI